MPLLRRMEGFVWMGVMGVMKAAGEMGVDVVIAEGYDWIGLADEYVEKKLRACAKQFLNTCFGSQKSKDFGREFENAQWKAKVQLARCEVVDRINPAAYGYPGR